MTAGRVTGALFLSAFLLYGVGDALSGTALGLGLMLGNSLAVATIGLLAHAALRARARRAARAYLVARVLEAVALGAGAVLLAVGNPEANADLYRVGMLALGLGSISLCLALSGAGWAPRWLAWWDVGGYAVLAGGVLLDLVLDGVLVAAFVPGGLFELVFGIHLLRQGFRAPATEDARGGDAVVTPSHAVRPSRTSPSR